MIVEPALVEQCRDVLDELIRRRKNAPVQFYADALRRGVCFVHADRQAPRYLKALAAGCDLNGAIPIAPHPHQAAFHRSEAQTRCILSGNRAGKTEAGIYEFGMAAMGIHPFWCAPVPGVFAMGTPGYKQGENILVKKALRVLGRGWLYEAGKNQLRYAATGSRILLFSYDQDIDKFSGDDFDGFLWDEEPPEGMRREGKMRLLDRSGREVFALTPIGENNAGSVTWMWDGVFIPWKEGVYPDGGEATPSEIGTAMSVLRTRAEREGWVAGVNPGAVEALALDALDAVPAKQWTVPAARLGLQPQLDVFSWDTDDNPYHIPEALEAEFRGASEDEVLERRRGKIIAARGLAFKELERGMHAVPDDWHPPKAWTLYRGLDWGFTNPCCILWCAVGPDDDIVVYRELYLREHSVKDLVAEARAMQFPGEEERIRLSFCETQELMHGKSSASDSIWHQFSVAGSLWLTPVKGNKAQRIALIHEYLLPRAGKPHVLGRAGDAAPRLYISKACKNTWRTLPRLRKIAVGANKQFREDFGKGRQEDHCCDALGNILLGRPRHVVEQPVVYPVPDNDITGY